MKRLLFAGAVAGLMLYFNACSSSKEIEIIPVEERFERGKALFDNESYLEAIEEFKIITVQYQGSEYADDAQFYIAESRYMRGEYILAAAEYDNLIRTMPSSPFVSIARYKKAMSYYNLSPKYQLDQKYTRFALDEFQTFVEYSPKDSMVNDAEAKIAEMTLKLAQKIYESGKLYYRVEYYKAAISYFDKVISEYRDSKFVDQAMFWKAKCLKERKKYDDALNVLTELTAKFPDTSLLPDIMDLQKNIEELRREELDEKQSQASVKNE